MTKPSGLSPHTRIPQVATSRVGAGWLTTCSCGHESWHPRRPGADRAAHEHQKTKHNPTKTTTATTRSTR